MTTPPRGRFIALEGIDGSGKTTQLEALAAWLPSSGLMPPGAELVTARAPGGTALGRRLRELLLHPPGDAEPCPVAELLLYVADTAQLVSEVIKPALAAGNWVLCDRFTGSTVAYQGYGRGHDLALLAQLNELATGGLEPDLTIWLDLPLGEALRRRSHCSADRIEAAGGAFWDRVIDGYQNQWSVELLQSTFIGFVGYPRWHYVSAKWSLHSVTEECKRILLALFSADATP